MDRKRHPLQARLLLPLVGGLLLIVVPAGGQDGNPPPGLFTPIDIPDWVDPLQGTDPAVLRSRPVTVDFAVLEALDPGTLDGQPSAPVRLHLFDDATVDVAFDQADPRWSLNPANDTVELIGYTWDACIVSQQQGHLVMITEPGVCAANIHVPGVGSFQLRPLGDVHVVRELEASTDSFCGVSADQVAPGQGGGGADGDAAAALGCDNGTRIDLIVVYTPLAKAQAEAFGTTMEIEIDIAVGETNVAYANSEINTKLRLLYRGEVDYSCPGECSLLGELSNQWDGPLDEVHPLRDALRADLVSLLFGAGEGSSAAFVMGSESPASESGGFSVVRWDQADAPDFHLAHELGHNMGCAHNRAEYSDCVGNCACQKGVFDYSFGYYFESYRTIMAHPPGSTINHFSNPNVLYSDAEGSYPTGIPSPSCDSADNALSINNTRDTVAGFRTSHDATDTTTMATFDYFSLQANGPSESPGISDTGQFVVFASPATNLADDDVNGVASDIFRFNRESGIVSLISLRHFAWGTTANGASEAPSISGNGRFVAFDSEATDLILDDNLDPIDLNDARDVYVRGVAPNAADRVAARVSIHTSSAEADADSFGPSISYDGRFVAFESDAANLVGSDNNGFRDIFLRDRDVSANGAFDEPGDVATMRVSVSSAGAEGDGPSFSASVSPDGGDVAFESDATNLVGGGVDSNGLKDVFVHDRTPMMLDPTKLVSLNWTGTQAGNGPSFSPGISQDGRFVAFASDATDLLAGGIDTNAKTDIFVRDRQTPQTTRVSVGLFAIQANGDSFAPSISADGRFVAFASDATNLVGPGGDTNGVRDVFVHDRQTGQTTRVSINSQGQEGNLASVRPAVSDDGRFIPFASDASNLVPVDVGGLRDIFFRDRGAMLLGDLNGDGKVDGTDLDILVQNWGPCPCCAADLDGDGDVDTDDKTILYNNWTG